MDNKKLFALIIVGILCLTMINAMDWDNVKSYNTETKTATIKNGLGLGGKVADITLLTSDNVQVNVGYNNIAKVIINNTGQYGNALKKIDFFNIKRGMQQTNKLIEYKYLDYESVEYNSFEEDCNNRLVNGSCSIVNKGKKIYTKEVWKDLNTKDLPEGIITIGLFTNVEKGDYVEWIPTWFGVEISEWATYQQVDIDQFNDDAIDGSLWDTVKRTEDTVAEQTNTFLNIYGDGSAGAGDCGRNGLACTLR